MAKRNVVKDVTVARMLDKHFKRSGVSSISPKNASILLREENGVRVNKNRIERIARGQLAMDVSGEGKNQVIKLVRK